MLQVRIVCDINLRDNTIVIQTFDKLLFLAICVADIISITHALLAKTVL